MDIYRGLLVLTHTWNNGIMEYWKVEDPVFSGIGFYKEVSHL